MLAGFFITLAASGVWMFVNPYNRRVDSIHSIVGILFLGVALIHVFNNYRGLFSYVIHSQTGVRASSLVILLFVCLVLIGTWHSIEPFGAIMDWKNKRKAGINIISDQQEYLIIGDGVETPFITIDFLKGRHFWNPQVALWLEDSGGNYLETLWVTNSTAKGQFFSGRTRDNFQELDHDTSFSDMPVRRVNALPHWAFNRGVRAKDGQLVPHSDEPLTDAISGATPTGSFYLNNSAAVKHRVPETFILKLEVNVAFDENAHYSEFDYLEDSIYHSGTGLLGQPSLIYAVTISKSKGSKYYLMELVGHGHHSGRDGSIYPDLSGITTAKEILERVVVKVDF